MERDGVECDGISMGGTGLKFHTLDDFQDVKRKTPEVDESKEAENELGAAAKRVCVNV